MLQQGPGTWLALFHLTLTSAARHVPSCASCCTAEGMEGDGGKAMRQYIEDVATGNFYRLNNPGQRLLGFPLLLHVSYTGDMHSAVQAGAANTPVSA